MSLNEVFQKVLELDEQSFSPDEIAFYLDEQFTLAYTTPDFQQWLVQKVPHPEMSSVTVSWLDLFVLFCTTTLLTDFINEIRNRKLILVFHEGTEAALINFKDLAETFRVKSKDFNKNREIFLSFLREQHTFNKTIRRDLVDPITENLDKLRTNSLSLDDAIPYAHKACKCLEELKRYPTLQKAVEEESLPEIASLLSILLLKDNTGAPFTDFIIKLKSVAVFDFLKIQALILKRIFLKCENKHIENLQQHFFAQQGETFYACLENLTWEDSNNKLPPVEFLLYLSKYFPNKVYQYCKNKNFACDQNPTHYSDQNVIAIGMVATILGKFDFWKNIKANPEQLLVKSLCDNFTKFFTKDSANDLAKKLVEGFYFLNSPHSRNEFINHIRDHFSRTDEKNIFTTKRNKVATHFFKYLAEINASPPEIEVNPIKELFELILRSFRMDDDTEYDNQLTLICTKFQQSTSIFSALFNSKVVNLFSSIVVSAEIIIIDKAKVKSKNVADANSSALELSERPLATPPAPDTKVNRDPLTLP